MARGPWPCCRSGSRDGGNSTSDKLYRVVNEPDNEPLLDEPAPIAPIGGHTNPVSQPNGDATELLSH